jgi:hypothetical protein
MFSNFFFLNCTVCTVYEMTWKNIVEQDRQQMTIQYGTCALHAGQLKLQTHAQNM